MVEVETQEERRKRLNREKQKRYVAANRERVLARRKQLRDMPGGRERDREYARRRYWADPQAANEKSASWRAANKGHLKAAERRRYEANKDKFLAKVAAWRLANPEKARAANVRKVSRWRQKNKEWHTATQSARRARQLSALPKSADLEAIEAIYAEARRLTESTGVKHSVDHIVPLNNPLVCGLHCEANLRVIPMVENSKKSNRYWPDMP
jgi:leucyl aminopeptidase (aminopeptidase T)